MMRTFPVMLNVLTPLNFTKNLHEPIRYLTEGSLVIKKPKRLKITKKYVNKCLKKCSPKSTIKMEEIKSEKDWLKNLTLENLKLYRKTLKGYRAINKNKLLEKLCVLNCVEHNQKDNKAPAESTNLLPNDLENVSEQKNDLPKFKLSKFEDDILNFPLLKTDFEQLYFKTLKHDKENFEPKNLNSFPSVTKILIDTMSAEAKFKLLNWRKKMIEELGKGGFYKYTDDPEFAIEINQSNQALVQTHTKRKRIIVDMKNQGSKLHSSIRQYLQIEGKEEVKIDPQIEGCWKSLEKLLPDISDVKLLEKSLYHPLLMYKGKVDCVASYRNIPCVIEWKRSEKRRSVLNETYDAPLQLCAYLGALSWQESLKLSPLKSALVVVVYTDGFPADLFLLQQSDCELYWTEWLRRLQKYWILHQHERNALVPKNSSVNVPL